MKGYADLLKQIRIDHEKNNLGLDKDSKVLIVDGLNSFLRVWSAVPSVNDDGDHIGGYIGFLRSIAAIIRQFKPTRCIIVFDGKGGSARRKKIYSGYKAGRSMSTKFNRRNDVGDQTVESEIISMKIQLINEQTSVWRPVEKKYYTPKEVLDRFGIPSHNFIHYKIFMGDGSDNIKGINGIGIKTLQSKFPLLLDDKIIAVEDVLHYCTTKKDEHKVYRTVLECEDQLRLNWQLMSLEDLDISSNFKLMIVDMANRPISKLDTFNFKKMFMRDKVYTTIPNVDSWLSTSFNSLDAYSQK